MEHYQPRGLALDIFKKRYAIRPDETWDEACERVAHHIAVAESGENISRYRQEFFDILAPDLFTPGGRIVYGSGRPKGQLLNCFVIPTADSREGWGKSTSDMIIICGTGGGLGTNFSPVRPRGTIINGTGGFASGAVSLMDIKNGCGEVIKAGGGRRTALMFALGLTHGDIEEFLDKKLDLKQLNNANISVVFDENPERFFELVRQDRDLELTFSGKVIGRISAKKIWKKIISNSLKMGEPGLLNGYYANRMNNIWYHKPVICTNPCVTGDTLVAVADGRNAVPIKQLAEEGQDVPVYSVHPGTGKTEIKWGINPRRTGEQKEVWRLTLDDGSVVRATPDHRFILRDLSERKLQDLRPGDSLLLRSKWKTSWDELIKDKCNSRSQDYWMVGSCVEGNRFEHGLIAEFNLGKKISKGEIVHHIDFCGLNNRPENLKVMTKEDHDSYHASLITGENNPYHRMSDEWKEDFARHEGPENGMFGRENRWGHHTDEAKQAIAEKHTGMKATDETRHRLSEIKIEQTRKKYEDAGIPQHVTRTCPNELCGKSFVVPWLAREQEFCSKDCFLQVFNRRKDVNDNKREKWAQKREAKRLEWLKIYTDNRFKLGRNLEKEEFIAICREQGVTARYGNATYLTHSDLKEAAAGYNHRVVSVEFDCYEDVYNITVEDNHNFAIQLPIVSKTASGKDKYNYILTPQCGEIWLIEYDCCDLGALVLPHFIRNGKVDYELLEHVIRIAVRFLDDVLTVNNYPIPEIKQTCSDIRRIGLGVTGLHDMLLLMGLSYNSDAGLEMVDRVMKFIKESAYNASIDLAIEKGPFPKFNAELYLKSGFIKTLRPSIRSRIREHGIRNCAMLTIAPVGTRSMVSDVTSGIECMFAPAHERLYRDGDELKRETVVHPLLKQFLIEGRDVSHFQGAYDIKIRDHFEMQRTCQRHLDNACSKTINLPPGTSEDELSDLYMEFFPELKGVTVYPEGSRENQPLTPLSLERAIELVRGEHSVATTGDRCRSGVCEL